MMKAPDQMNKKTIKSKTNVLHGLPKGQLLLVEHQATWLQLYQEEIDRIRDSIKIPECSYFHIGSTAVPGLLAKPIIDIAIVFQDAEQLWHLTKGLVNIDYTFRGTHLEPNHWYFVFDRENLRLFQVHAWLEGSPGLHRHLSFVQKLIEYPLLRDRYAELKRIWAGKANWDKHRYSSSKNEFVEEVLKWPTDR